MARKQKINDKQRALCLSYLNGLNMSQAARDARMTVPTAWRELKKPICQQFISEQFSKTRTRTIVSIDSTLREMALIMSSDITDYFDSNGGMLTFKDLSALPPEATRAIQSLEETISPTGEVRIKIKLHPKMEAIKTAAQHLGLIVEQLRIQLGHTPGGEPIKTQSLHYANVVTHHATPLHSQGVTHHDTPNGELPRPAPVAEMTIAQWERQCMDADKLQHGVTHHVTHHATPKQEDHTNNENPNTG